MVRSITLLLFLCQIATAQENAITDPFSDPGVVKTPEDVSSDSKAAQQPQRDTEEEKKDWQPKLAITLTTSPEGVNVMREVTRRVPKYITEYEDKEILRNERTVKVKVAVQKLTWQEVKQRVSLPGSAQILCDEMNLKMEASATHPSFSFECNGRLILQTTGSSISAESGSYAGGKLKLVNAKVQQASMTMEAESLIIDMTVFGVSTVTAPAPNQDTPFIRNRPEPDRLFDQNDVDDFQDNGVPHPKQLDLAPSDDWNPGNQRRSQPKDDVARPSRFPEPADTLDR